MIGFILGAAGALLIGIVIEQERITNMDNDQITDLSREYAEECIDPNGFSRGTYKELVEEKAEMTASVLRWLCDRYFLVEKKEFLNLIETHRSESKGTDKGAREWFFYTGRLDLLKSLFPDLEPCTEPKEPSFTDTFTDDRQSQCKSQSRNLSQDPANCDKKVDDILSPGFREHNRLHIAAMAMAGLLANPQRTKEYGEIAMRESESRIALTVAAALRYADALILEASKQSNQ